MTTLTNDALTRRWRMLAWGGAAGLLALPAVAMLFTAEVKWDAADFLVMGVLLFGLAGVFDFLLRRGGGLAYQLGSALGLAATFLLIWVELAVGIIGDGSDPRNLLFAGVILAALSGAIGAGLEARGMARAMAMAAVVQALAALIALTGPVASEEPGEWIRAIAIMTTFLCGIWLTAAWLFRRVARDAMPGA